jgi:tRNA U34 5-carboxymethylaminomethyl modifying GTPase MnmE/TrmE
VIGDRCLLAQTGAAGWSGGRAVAIVGAPNVGKSSLFNACSTRIARS